MCTRVLTSHLPSVREGSLSSSSASSTLVQSQRLSGVSRSTASLLGRASTSIYEQVPFTELLPRILELCRTLWPNACHSATEVGRMRGGIDNRVLELSIVHCQGAEKTQYILRVPRYEYEDRGEVDKEVAYLKFVKENSNIPVPEVVAFDGTVENPLQAQYMIQQLVPGEPLEFVYDCLDHEGKCNIARELGGIYRQMQQMKSTVPGLLAREQDDHGSSSFSMVEVWPQFCESAPTKRKDALPARSCSETLIWIYERRKAWARSHTYYTMIDEMEKCIEMTKEMEALGYLDDSQISLWHNDMMPTNIMVDSTTRPTISALLDWDDAVFVPRFLSCDPPLFLWAWNPKKSTYCTRPQEPHEYEDPLLAEEIPATAELRELKRIFDEAAGPEYVRYAYGPQYRIARDVFAYTTADGWGNEDADDIRLSMAEWAEFKRKTKGDFRSRMKKRFFNVANLFPRRLPFLSRRQFRKPSDSQ